MCVRERGRERERERERRVECFPSCVETTEKKGEENWGILPRKLKGDQQSRVKGPGGQGTRWGMLLAESHCFLLQIHNNESHHDA